MTESKEEVNLFATMDARTWADEFNRVLVSKGEEPFDPGWLIGWFANAIMCGHDHNGRKLNKEIDRLTARIKELEGALSDVIDELSSQPK